MKTIFAVGTFLMSLLLTYAAIRIFAHFDHLGQDHHEKVQKFHTGSVPRIAGLPLFITISMVSFFSPLVWPDTKVFRLILLSALPILVAGIFEDLTAKSHAYLRFFASIISAILFVFLTDQYIYRSELVWLDSLLENLWVAYLLTVIGIAGLTNGFNIVDGFNGLAAFTAIFLSAGVALIGFYENNFELVFMAGSVIAVLFGFLYFNFPWGRIFLGDGGAYMIGFLLGALAILAIYNHSVSPVALLLLAGYPVIETLFSFTRKTLISGKHPFQPDELHLHMLVYRWLQQKHVQAIQKERLPKYLVNSLVTVYMLPFLILPLLIVLFEYKNSSLLLSAFIGYVIMYLLFYAYFFRVVVILKNAGDHE